MHCPQWFPRFLNLTYTPSPRRPQNWCFEVDDSGVGLGMGSGDSEFEEWGIGFLGIKPKPLKP